ncbi:hypothetical protein Acid7E03_43650 [Acidisoma sp. 7E03]
MVEVQLRLQKALVALGRLGDADVQAAAREQVAFARARAEAALDLEAERRRLQRVGEEVTAISPAVPIFRGAAWP